MKRNKANQLIQIKERRAFEKKFNLLKNYRWHSLLWYLVAEVKKWHLAWNTEGDRLH
jgi:hypothetical protein